MKVTGKSQPESVAAFVVLYLGLGTKCEDQVLIVSHLFSVLID